MNSGVLCLMMMAPPSGGKKSIIFKIPGVLDINLADLNTISQLEILS
jgi:hypothetical protein